MPTVVPLALLIVNDCLRPRTRASVTNGMPVSITEEFGIDPSAFADTGAFDALLDIDTLLFIDPALLKGTTTPEFEKADEAVKQHFAEVVSLLAQAKEGDVLWTEASRRLQFPEVEGLCIGYATRSTAGSGMGASLRDDLLRSASTIITAGIRDPEIFELAGLFQDDIGPDRISDMIANILLDMICAFSTRVFSDLGVEIQEREVQGKKLSAPLNPNSGKAVLLVPRDILRDLPIANDWSEIDTVAAHNAELRGRLNATIGSTWKQITRKLRKVELRETLFSDPELLRELIDLYKGKPPTTYDFRRDPGGQVLWRSARRFAVECPLELAFTHAPDIDEVERVVLDICYHFKTLVEDNGLCKLFYDDDKKPRHERFMQLAFFGIAEAYCKANNLDPSPEVDGGRGPLDFKFSIGYEARIALEIKKSTNGKLIEGYQKQLPTYQQAEKTRRAIYLVLDIGASEEKLQKIRDTFAAATGPGAPRLILVDSLLRPSASLL